METSGVFRSCRDVVAVPGAACILMKAVMALMATRVGKMIVSIRGEVKFCATRMNLV